MPTNPTNLTKPGVTINILLPMALHRQLRLRAMAQDMMMKDAVVEAIEAWLAPAKRHGPEPDLTQVRAEARALSMRELAALIIEGRGAEAQALLHEAEDAAGMERTLV